MAHKKNTWRLQNNVGQNRKNISQMLLGQYIERKKIIMDIKLEKDKLFDPLGLKRLRESYMMEDETSLLERFGLCIKRLWV